MSLAERPHLLGLTPEDLARWLRAEGVAIRDDEARRLVVQRLSPMAARSRERRPLARALVAEVEHRLDRSRLDLVERVTDPGDGFVKYLFRSPDGAAHEAVRIPLQRPGRFSVCLSSQVGCAMGCVFCATGRLGFGRSLRAWEMVAAFAAVRDEAPGRVSGAVFMGQGEPFHNYDEVIQAARVLSHPCGGAVDARAITISTVGIVPQIRRYTRERHPYRLIVSLTSALAERRARWLPVAGAGPVEDLARAIADHTRATGERVRLAWVLLGGENHDRAEVEALRRLFASVAVSINLIDVNDARPDGFRRASDGERKEFVDALQALGVPIVRRYSGGAARHAACGMLAARRLAAQGV